MKSICVCVFGRIAFASIREASTLPKAAEVAKLLKQYPLFLEATKKGAKTKEVPADSLLTSRKKTPSITAILEATRSAEDVARLEAWKKRKILELGGEEQFQEFSEDMKNFSKQAHSMIRLYVEESIKPSSLFLNKNDGKLMNVFLQLEKLERNSISRISNCETRVTHSSLNYLGVCDCIMEVSGVQLVVDWKIPNDPDRRRLGLGDCNMSELLQCAAYMGAINHSKILDQPLDGFALVYLYHHNGSPPDAHVVTGKDCHPFWACWVNKVKQFHAL